MIRTLFAALCFATLPLAGQADTVTVFAAASLKDAMDRITPAFEAASGHELAVSLAGSSTLSRQIDQGAPADVFISANVGWMDDLETKGKIDPSTHRNLLGNTLVLIGPPVKIAPIPISSDYPLADRLGDGLLAMALIDSVPAGIYGKAALEHLGLWEAIESRVAQTDNVRAALALVALREAPYGITYATDAAAEPRVSVIGTFPEDSHPPIIYPVAATAGSDSDGTQAFLDYLSSHEAAAAFEEAGFNVLGQIE